MDHPSGRQGPEEWWYELRSYSPVHNAALRYRLHGDLAHLQACREAQVSYIRDHTLIRFGLVKIINNIPVITIINI